MIPIIKKTKRILKDVLGINPIIKKTVRCKYDWYGTDYGGCYVYPDVLNENSIVYSVGIGEDISFDIAMIEKHHCKVFGFDPTPKSIEWVKQQKMISNFSFNPYGLGDKTEIKTFYLPKNASHVSGSLANSSNIDSSRKVEVPIKCLTDIAKELKHHTIDVLKMDIEGSEYEVIPDILNSGVSIKQIIVEFHHRFVENGKQKTVDAIKLLKSHGFEVFAIADTFEEISLIRKDIL